jgi:hypothetical protein
MAFSITTSFGAIILSAVLPVVLPKGIMLNVVILGDVLFIVMMMAVTLKAVHADCCAYIGILSGMFILLS